MRATSASLFVRMPTTDDALKADSGLYEQTGSNASGLPWDNIPPIAADYMGDVLAGEEMPSKFSGDTPSNKNDQKEDANISVSKATSTTASNSATTGSNTARPETGEKHGPHDRFKVVKIETVIAKEVGRWTFVDYTNRSAPVASNMPSFFPGPLKSGLKSASKPLPQNTQSQPGQTAIQSSAQKNIPAISSTQQTKVTVRGSSYKVIPDIKCNPTKLLTYC